MAKLIVTALTSVLLLGALGIPMVRAQPALAEAAHLRTPDTLAVLSGQTLQGQSFDLKKQRGKVVMVLFWSTTCAVCRDKMAELRANYRGWRDEPFELVLVSTDRRVQDVHDYEQILALTVPSEQQFPQLWLGQPGYADNFGPQRMLPATFIINKSGRVEKSYVGRIPPQAWDDIADLL
jgi:peroxiredoxin